MIPHNANAVYAQYGEDIVLRALFSDVNNGFYVDVGANYPVIDSVTKAFYDDGWNGINIEPIPSLYEQLVKNRPRDINLQIGVGDRKQELTFLEDKKSPGHSMFGKKKPADSEFITEHKIKVNTLTSIFKKYKVRSIHFLKIDVEGFEQKVIDGNDWSVYRPEVICIEANHRETQWQNTLLENRYKMFISDGLNEYYLAEESWRRTEDFAEKAVLISYNSLKQHHFKSWKDDSRQLEKVSRLNQTHYDLWQDSVRQIKELESRADMSLKNVGMLQRIKRAAYGLTVDWVRYKLK